MHETKPNNIRKRKPFTKYKSNMPTTPAINAQKQGVKREESGRNLSDKKIPTAKEIVSRNKGYDVKPCRKFTRSSQILQLSYHIYHIGSMKNGIPGNQNICSFFSKHCTRFQIYSAVHLYQCTGTGTKNQFFQFTHLI